MKKLVFAALFFGLLNPAAFAEDRENPWIAATAHIMEPQSEPAIGMTKKEFFKGRGMADKRELRNGAEVLWFDGDEPYYAEFKNQKLTSYYIDKETIERRADEFRKEQETLAQAQHEDRIRDQERAQTRRQNILRAFQPQTQQAYQIPVNKSVNCTTNRIGNTAYTNCN